MLKSLAKWPLLVAVGLICPLLTFSQTAKSQDSKKTCDNATLNGTYVYSYSGYSVTGKTRTRFAVAGFAVFHGDGTSNVVSTTATEGQPVASLVTYTGAYTVQPDCTATETDADQTGAVTHYDDFTDPSGKTVSYVETDPNVVTSGYETRR
jgi:hypothetical protein